MGSLVGQWGVSNWSLRRVTLPDVTCLVPQFGHPMGHFSANYPPFMVKMLKFCDADKCTKIGKSIGKSVSNTSFEAKRAGFLGSSEECVVIIM